AMGVTTVLNFQPTADGKAAITGDFVLLDKEVNAVARTLRQHGIDVTAIHNHGLMDTPRLFYMHFWATDDAVKLAQGLRAAPEPRDRVFTSNRGENTVGIFAPGDEASLVRVPVGVRPNGLAYDPERDLLLAANVGDPARPESYTVSLVDVASHTLVADVPVAGRTRWAVFDGARAAFCVNIAGPPWIQIVDARTRLVTRTIP